MGCAPQAEEKGASHGPGATASCAPGKLATQVPGKLTVGTDEPAYAPGCCSWTRSRRRWTRSWWAKCWVSSGR
ncbi:hypothetical protein [Streptomyces globisporus]|uniref:hypothetical protein n=1 Tax=Streptomyces globisporus TaxID=1908 RepID=UPI001F0C9C00|nr:hypothetical protein [Streptomyces globisporus]